MGAGECTADALGERTAPAVAADSDPCTVEFCDDETGAREAVRRTSRSVSVLTTAAGSMRFLYEGPDAVQYDVAPGVFSDSESAVVRGRVIWEDGLGVPNARVELLNGAEYGWTRTQIDGYFVMVVPSGAESVLR